MNRPGWWIALQHPPATLGRSEHEQIWSNVSRGLRDHPGGVHWPRRNPRGARDFTSATDPFLIGRAAPAAVVSHWYGEAHLTRESYAGGGPGGALGVALSTPHSKTEATMTAVLREEIDPLLKRRVIVESISWTSSVSDLYYVNPDKSKVPAGKGGKGSGTLTEKELYLSYDLSGFQQAVTDAKQSVDGLTTKAQEAHRQAVAADEALAKTQVRLTALSAAAASDRPAISRLDRHAATEGPGEAANAGRHGSLQSGNAQLRG